MTRYTNLCHDMRRKRRKQSITANRRKWRKIKEISIFKEFLRHDKNIICLPWQCLRDGAKALSLLGFLDGNVEFTPYLHLWKIGLVIKT